MEFQTLYQELANSTEMIRTLSAGIDESEARIKPDEKSWSMLEVICHLYDEEREDFTRIYCAIIVERSSQKTIIIGKGAARLKEIGIKARHDIEHLIGHRCHLELFVKVEKDWRDKEHLLDGMGVN